MKPYGEYRDTVRDALDTITEQRERAVFVALEDMHADHMKDVSALVDALNDLHMTYHGHGTALVMCPVHPCTAVYDIVRGVHE